MTAAEGDAAPEAERPPRRRRLTRRRFLIGAASGAGLLLVGAPIALDRGRPFLAEQVLERGIGDPEIPEPMVWFELTPAGVTLHVPKIEMGQGIHTALAQIALAELPLLDADTLAVVQADTRRGFAGGTMFTFGSTSVSSLYQPLRTAAAAVREMLLADAAERLGADRQQLAMTPGEISVFGQATAVSVAEIVRDHEGTWEPPEDADLLTDPSAPIPDLPRVDMRDKLTGSAVYGYDARLPGMRYGAVARPPRFGAELVSAQAPDWFADEGVELVLDLEAGFAGVVAPSRTLAWNARDALDTAWSGGTTASTEDLEAALDAEDGAVIRRTGNLREALADGTVVEAAYRTPYAAHAHLEPLAALATVTPATDDAPAQVEAWVPTQAPDTVIDQTRELLGDDAEVVVHVTYLGGSFGRKGSQDAALEAVRLSRAAGVPVHVGWTREEDLRHGLYRPPTHTRLRGTVGTEGRIRGVEQHSSSGDIIWAVAGLPEFVRGTLGFDPGTLLGQFLPYDLPAYRVHNQRQQLEVPTGPWRGLGLLPNVFATESFVDELALAAGVDPLAFRLDHLPATETGDRLAAALRAAAEESGWDTPPEPGRGRGIACSVEHDTVVAQVAEVSVTGGEITVHRVVCVVDPGLVISESGARLQSVGSVVMGLSSALLEHLPIADGAVLPGNVDGYPILPLDRTPPIDVTLVESSEVPHGLGEPVLGPVAAAVANAVAAATGERLRTLPLRPTEESA